MESPVDHLQAFCGIERHLGVDFDTTSTSSQSFGSSPSVRSHASSVGFDLPENVRSTYEKHRSSSPRTPLLASRNFGLDLQAEEQLKTLLRSYIVYRCSLNEHCFQRDFDETALEALSRMSFIQALQTVEHFSASVSPRIQKRSAYLMGILRGQEAHWDRFVAPNTHTNRLVSLKGKEILRIPSQLLVFVGQCCLEGNCLPSDFTPEVCLSLHSLPINLALKSVSAFNSNKRIVAGVKGGVINRARFFLRLIQNVAEQNLTQANASSPRSYTPNFNTMLHKVNSMPTSTYDNAQMDRLCRQFSDNVLTEKPLQETRSSSRKASESSWRTRDDELNLEELADLDFSESKTINNDSKVKELQVHLNESHQREQKLLKELTETRQHLAALQTDYIRLKTLINGY